VLTLITNYQEEKKMAYDTTKLVKLGALKSLAEKINTDFTKNKDFNALKSQVDGLVSTGGQPNVIESVKVNGVAQEVQDKAVNITVPTKVSDLNNDSQFQTQSQVASAIAAADHMKRKIVDSTDEITLDAPDASQYIYMVLKSSTKNGDKYDEYMVLDGALEKVGDWAVDLSGYVQKEEGKGLSTNDYTTEEKEKLAGIEEGANKYTHPQHTAAVAGLYKVTVDELGHVTAAEAVSKNDITGLGIPAKDTTYSDVTANGASGLMSGTDKAKLDGIVIAEDTEVTEMINEVFADKESA
jgi:hypothetical protein